MPAMKSHKVVSALPGTLEADSVYYVKNGASVDAYVTNGAGEIIAYPLASGGGSQQVFVQQTQPTAGGSPWVWLETDAGGLPLDIVFYNGVP